MLGELSVVSGRAMAREPVKTWLVPFDKLRDRLSKHGCWACRSKPVFARFYVKIDRRRKFQRVFTWKLSAAESFSAFLRENWPPRKVSACFYVKIVCRGKFWRVFTWRLPAAESFQFCNIRYHREHGMAKEFYFVNENLRYNSTKVLYNCNIRWL